MSCEGTDRGMETAGCKTIGGAPTALWVKAQVDRWRIPVNYKLQDSPTQATEHKLQSTLNNLMVLHG